MRRIPLSPFDVMFALTVTCTVFLLQFLFQDLLLIIFYLTSEPFFLSIGEARFQNGRAVADDTGALRYGSGTVAGICGPEMGKRNLS